jgi:putative MATE family efflux protein
MITPENSVSIGGEMKNNNDLTQGSISKKLMLLSLPIMLSNFLQTFYNLTDAFWLGKLGENAKDAVSVAGIAFPVIFFISSFGFGFVIAGTALVSRFKGAGTENRIPRVIGQFTLVLIAFILFFLAINTLFLDPLLNLLETPDAIKDLCSSYLHIIMIGMIFMFVFMSFQSVCHGLGDTITPMIIQIVSVGLNVVLDPFLIFGWTGLPRMETIGAAWATLIARIVAAVLAIYFLQKKYRKYLPATSDLVPDKVMLKNIFKIGIPASFSQSVTSLGFLILQGFVNSFGVTVISAYSIGNRLNSFFMMPAMGISNALSSFVGQNLGANKIRRVERGVMSATVIISIIMGLGGAALFIFGTELTKIFINDPGVAEIGNIMFKLVSVASFLFGFIFVINGVFNGAGYTLPTMILNISRLWIVRLPLTFVLSGKILQYLSQGTFVFRISEMLASPFQDFPFSSLWWAMMVSNFITGLLSWILYFRGGWKHKKIG